MCPNLDTPLFLFSSELPVGMVLGMSPQGEEQVCLGTYSSKSSIKIKEKPLKVRPHKNKINEKEKGVS